MSQLLQGARSNNETLAPQKNQVAGRSRQGAIGTDTHVKATGYIADGKSQSLMHDRHYDRMKASTDVVPI